MNIDLYAVECLVYLKEINTQCDQYFQTVCCGHRETERESVCVCVRERVCVCMCLCVCQCLSVSVCCLCQLCGQSHEVRLTSQLALQLNSYAEQSQRQSPKKQLLEPEAKDSPTHCESPAPPPSSQTVPGLLTITLVKTRQCASSCARPASTKIVVHVMPEACHAFQ